MKTDEELGQIARAAWLARMERDMATKADRVTTDAMWTSAAAAVREAVIADRTDALKSPTHSRAGVLR